jgi:hypothetical protein
VKTDKSVVDLLQQYADSSKGTVAECSHCGISYVKNRSDPKKSNLCIVCTNTLKPKRRKHRKLKTKEVYGVCHACNTPYLKRAANQKYCSTKCLRSKRCASRYGVGRCSSCGRFFSKKKAGQRYCGAECAKKNPDLRFSFVPASVRHNSLRRGRAQRVSQIQERLKREGICLEK